MPHTPVARNAAWLALLCALTILGWWLPNRLQNPDAGVRVEKFNSLSYGAYRPGQSPLNDRFATAAEVDEDLALLAPRTRAIRTYAALEGPYDIPALAQKHGLKIWQGIWLGGDRAKNQLEMARAIDMAHRYPDTIERLIVGNEVLLRRDLPVDELIADIDHVRAAVKQPVAYADVSDFWDQFPQVAPHVDVVLIHLLPYWEDVPTGIDHAVATVGEVYQHFVKLFPGRKIAIGETGWPSRGRQRRDALPSRINEARFLREFIALSQARQFDYNVIEAFDQDWKYENEGIVGANWGILSADRTAKIPTRGPLREDPLWARHAAFSIACTLILLCLGTAPGHRFESSLPFFRGEGWVRGLGAARHVLAGPAPQSLLAVALGVALGIAQADAAPVLFDAHVRLAAVVNLGGQALLAGLMMLRARGALPAAPDRTGADATHRVLALLRLQPTPWRGLFEDLYFLFAWTAAVLQVLLVFDPRYREFPLASFAVPLVVLVARFASNDFAAELPGGREEILAAATLTVGALVSAIQEGMLNGQSLRWNACVLLLSLPLWFRSTSPLYKKAPPAMAV
jgi:exo-beta-1,3-glucanase (GH17 family)